MNEPILTSNVTDIQPRIVRRELNLDFGQFFYPSYKRVYLARVYESEVTDAQGEKKIKAEVSFHPKYGTLNAFDERIFYVLIEMWQDQGKPETVYFSEREIARQLNISWTGNTTGKAIKESLIRLRSVLIEWDGSFFHKPSNRLISINNPFTILSHLKTVSTKDGGIKQQLAECRFDERVIQNLESKYSRPILLDTVLSFSSPMAQSLYTYLEPRLYGTNHFNRTSKGLFLEDLGLIGSSYQRQANRVQYIKRAREELIGKLFYYDEAITNIEITNGKQDAIFHAYRSGVSKPKGRVIEIPYQPAATAPKEEQKRKKARKAPESTLTPKVEDNPKATPKTSPRALQDVYELLKLFTKTFYDQDQHEFSKNDVLLAEDILKQHRMDKAKYFIRFAKAEAGKTNYKPQYFRGIKKYLKPAIANFDRERRISRRYEEENHKRNVENEKIDHEKKFWLVYEEFVSEQIEHILDNHPKRFDSFRKLQTQERSKVQEKFNDKPKLQKQMLDLFDKPSQAILRVVSHFKDDPELHIPTFSEWDEKYNPDSFDRCSGAIGSIRSSAARLGQMGKEY